MKMPLDWHINNLKNIKNFYQKELETIDRVQKRAKQTKRNILYLEGQILRAERLGKDGFDAERFKPEPFWKNEIDFTEEN